MRSGSRLARAAHFAVALVALPIVIAVPVAADSSSTSVVVDTAPLKPVNGQFTVDPKFAPQLGQSFALSSSILAQTIVLHPNEVSIAKKPEYLVSRYDFSHFTYHHKDKILSASTVLNIWRANDGVTLPTDPGRAHGFNIAGGGFTNVYTRAYSVPVEIGQPFVLPLDPPLQLAPGTYVAAWYFAFDDKRIFGVRFAGEVNGHVDGGGYFFDGSFVPSNCRYAPLRDSSPPGSLAYAADQWAPPSGVAATGPFPGTIGYHTWFKAYPQKTPNHCVKPTVVGWSDTGVPLDRKGKRVKDPYYKEKYPPLNTGDLDMQILGTPLPG